MTLSRRRGRKDHYLPQGYLRGFIDPSRQSHPKPLWVFDIPHGKWRESSTSEVGFSKGFYDPMGAGTELEFADATFSEFERKFPLVRRDLIATGFTGWEQHLDFLLGYMDMIRARSLLYFSQKQKEKENTPAWVVTEVISPTEIKVEPKALSRDFIRNRTLVEMKEEIEHGPVRLRNFDWALRYCDSVEDCCTTSESPFVMEGVSGDIAKDFADPTTLLIFPVCWQACLFGSLSKFNVKTDKFLSQDLWKLRTDRKANSSLFIISPTRQPAEPRTLEGHVRTIRKA